MSRPWPQERNTSLSFALEFLHEPQSWNQPALQKPSALTWHAQLNCQRTFRPKVDLGSPHRGATRNEGERHNLHRLSVPAVEHFEG